MANSIEGGKRFSRDEAEALLSSREVKEGPLTFKKASGILDLAAFLHGDLVLASGLAIQTNSVMRHIKDGQLIAPLAVWDMLPNECPEEWVHFMRELEGGERRQIRTMLQSVRKSREDVDLGMVREESALGELIKRSGISVVRQAFLYIATRKIESTT